MYYLLLFLITYTLFILAISPKFRENHVIFKIMNSLFSIFLIFMIGFRYEVGTDYKTYEQWFNEWYQDITIEWIYTGLNYFVKVSGGEFYHLTLLLAIISQILLMIGFKKWELSSKEISIGLILYTTSYIFVFSNGVRQGLAVLIVFIAAKYIVDRKLLKFLLIIFIGIGFHKSIVVMLPFYFVFHKLKINFKTTLFMIFATYFLVGSGIAMSILEFGLSISFYGEKYSDFDLIYSSSSSLLSPGVFLKVAILVVLLYFSKNKYIEHRLVINFYIIGTLIKILSLSTYLYNRIGLYFQFLEIIATILILRKINDAKLKFLLLALVIVVNVILMYKSIVIDGELHDFTYKSIFNK